MGTVKKVVMNDTWTAALTDGQVFLHQIEDDVEKMRMFPQNKNQEPPIVNIAMAGEFLILIDAQGKLKYYLINDNAVILEHLAQDIFGLTNENASRGGDNKIVSVFPN